MDDITVTIKTPHWERERDIKTALITLIDTELNEPDRIDELGRKIDSLTEIVAALLEKTCHSSDIEEILRNHFYGKDIEVN